MYLYFDEGGYVIGYGSENEPGSVAVQAIPEEVDRYLGAYRYEGGAFIPDEARKAFLEQAWNAQQELDAITRWFNWYDQQCIQYQRSLRLGLPFDRDIGELDRQAQEKAARTNALRALLSEPYQP